MKFLFAIILILLATTACKEEDLKKHLGETNTNPVITIPPKKGIQLPDITSLTVKFESQDSFVVSSVNGKSSLTLGMDSASGSPEDYKLAFSLPAAAADIVESIEFIKPGSEEKVSHICTAESCSVDASDMLMENECEGISFITPMNGNYSFYLHKKNKVVQHFKFEVDFQCPEVLQATAPRKKNRSIASYPPSAYDRQNCIVFSLSALFALLISSIVLFIRMRIKN